MRNGAKGEFRKGLRMDFKETDCGLEAFHSVEGVLQENYHVRDQLVSFANRNAIGDAFGRVIDRAGKIAKPLGYGWLAAAGLTWMLCPSPAPFPSSLSAGVRFADEAGYLIECLTLWPAVAYFTLEQPSK
jgi:hypothetical protein